MSNAFVISTSLSIAHAGKILEQNSKIMRKYVSNCLMPIRPTNPQISLRILCRGKNSIASKPIGTRILRGFSIHI